MQGVDWESPKNQRSSYEVNSLISETRNKLVESSDSLIDVLKHCVKI